MKRIAAVAAVVLCIIGATSYVLHTRQPGAGNKQPAPGGKLLAAYAPPRANGLVTNEFAYFNPTQPGTKTSSIWQMTSGSLFAKDGTFWTGKPDSCNGGPNAQSTNCTDSNVFRLNTAQKFSGNIKLSFALKQNDDIHNNNCNADTCWHGTHLWLRYQDPYNLYYVSLNRADGTVVIKRKVPCGPTDGGTYFVLGKYVKHDFKTGAWNSYAATIQTNRDGSVTIKLYDENYSATTPIDTATDRGGTNPNWSTKCATPGHYPSLAYAPISADGSVGIRGDYADFAFKNFRVSAL